MKNPKIVTALEIIKSCEKNIHKYIHNKDAYSCLFTSLNIEMINNVISSDECSREIHDVKDMARKHSDILVKIDRMITMNDDVFLAEALTARKEALEIERIELLRYLHELSN